MHALGFELYEQVEQLESQRPETKAQVAIEKLPFPDCNKMIESWVTLVSRMLRYIENL
jgi:hypothetical protein